MYIHKTQYKRLNKILVLLLNLSLKINSWHSVKIDRVETISDKIDW